LISARTLFFTVLGGLVVAMALFGVHREPDPGRETTYWLAIESAAADGDELLAETDRTRFTEQFGHRPIGARVAVSGGEKRLDSPALWTGLMSASRRLGRRAPAIVQSLLFVLAAGLAYLLLGAAMGESSAALIVLTSLFASAAVLVPVRLEPRVIEMVAMAAACAAVWKRRSTTRDRTPGVYRGSLDRAPALGRWVLSGLCFGVVLAGTPTYLPLALPLIAAAEPERRWSRGVAFALSATSVLGAIAVFSGALWEPIEPVLSLRLFGWALAGLLGGRGVGLLPFFIPALYLMLASGRSSGKHWAPLAVVAAALLQALAAPFDYVEGGLAAGNAWFLPALVLLLCSSEAFERARSMLALSLLSVPFLLPTWLSAVGASGLAGQAAARLAVVGEFLPVPSTLRAIPGAALVERAGLQVQGLAPAVTGVGDGRLRWRGRRAVLVVASDRPMSSLRLDLSANAPADIELRGGRLGNTTYRPSGELSVDVLLGPRSERRHPAWFARGDGARTYVLELRVKNPPEEPILVDVPFGRGVLPSSSPP